MTGTGSSRTQEPFEFHRSDHIGILDIPVGVKRARIEGLEAGGENHRPYVQIQDLFFLIVIDGICRTDLGANSALLAMSQLTAILRIDGVGGRDGLSVVLENGLAFAESRIVGVDHHCGALFGTCTTGDAFIEIYIARFLEDFYLKISFFTADAFQLRIGEKVDVEVPADLDQLWRKDSHCAFIGGKRFVQLRHASADGRAFFQEMHIISRIGQVQGRLHA